MTRIVSLVIATVLIATLGGCAYIDTRAPYDADLNRTDLGTRIGKSHNYSVLWLVAWGDGSYAAAAQDGGITVLKHADVDVFSVLFGLYVRRTIIV